jgi:hypothetical protein
MIGHLFTLLLVESAAAPAPAPSPAPFPAPGGVLKSGSAPRRRIMSVARPPLPMLLPSLEELEAQARKKRRRAALLLFASGAM